MYATGSLNSSSVGRYVGASNKSCGRPRFGFSFDAGAFVSTVLMSNPWARRELSGGGGAVTKGWKKPLVFAGAAVFADFILVPEAGAVVRGDGLGTGVGVVPFVDELALAAAGADAADADMPGIVCFWFP